MVCIRPCVERDRNVLVGDLRFGKEVALDMWFLIVRVYERIKLKEPKI